MNRPMLRGTEYGKNSAGLSSIIHKYVHMSAYLAIRFFAIIIIGEPSFVQLPYHVTSDNFMKCKTTSMSIDINTSLSTRNRSR